MTHQLVVDLILILAGGLMAGLVCKRIGVPSLIGYMIVGLLIGPGGIGWIHERSAEVEHVAEVGVFLLLFAIGLEFSLEELVRLGWRFLVGGGSQMLLVALPVYFALTTYGLDWRAAALISAATAFSSTVLVFKSLFELGQASQPHGARAIGILLFQDAALVPLLLLIPLLTDGGAQVELFDYAMLALRSVGFLLGVAALRFILARWAIPLLAAYRSLDLVVLFTIVSIAAVTMGAYSLGLPPAIGAFAAGLIFNGNRWSHQIDSLVLPFRETFAAVFFVSLGVLLKPSLLMDNPWQSLGLIVAIVVVKAIASSVALRLTGLNMKTSTAMGVGLAHIGEFAIVLVLMGSESGVIERNDAQRFVALAIVTLIITPLLIKFGLRRIETIEAASHHDTFTERLTTGQAIVVGAGPTGRRIASQLELTGFDVCIVDLSPLNLNEFAQQGFRTVLGNAAEQRTLQQAGLADSSLLVLCVPNDQAALRIARAARVGNPQVELLVRCRFQANVAALRKAGAKNVVSEEIQACEALMAMLDKLA